MPNDTKPSRVGQISRVRPMLAPRRRPRSPVRKNCPGETMLATITVSCIEWSTSPVAPAQTLVKEVRAALTANDLAAADALAMGMINRVVPDDELHTATLDLLRRATRGSARSKALGKRTFYAQVGLDQADAYDLAVDVMADAAVSRDAQEGIAAFLGKRHASFTERGDAVGG